MDLITVMAKGTMQAAVLHAQERGISKQLANNTDIATREMSAVMKAEWPEFMDTVKVAVEGHMGNDCYKAICNTYANAWAVKALCNAGMIQ